MSLKCIVLVVCMLLSAILHGVEAREILDKIKGDLNAADDNTHYGLHKLEELVKHQEYDEDSCSGKILATTAKSREVMDFMENIRIYNAWSCAIIFLFLLTINAKPLDDDDSTLSFNPTTNGVEVRLFKGATEKLVGTIGTGIDFSDSTCVGKAECIIGDILLRILSIPGGFQIAWETKSDSVVFKDCFDLQTGDVNWYGGPEKWAQEWPIEKITLNGNDPYIIKRSDNSAVAERYWLNSKGAYIFVDDRAPLFVDQNNEENGKVCFIAKLQEPYINRERNFFNYTIVAEENPKVAHLHAVNYFLGKAAGHPDERMISQPVWTTWAKFKKDIDDDIVLSFAQDILSHGFQGGQIEIDDDWERCYGAQEFKSDKFAHIADTVSQLKEMDFRVTLWVHPFVNDDCQNVSSVGLENGYFVKNTEGSTAADWWDGGNAHETDFTNPEAAEWFSARLRKLQEDVGIDSFKFDAGETNYAVQPSVYDNVDVETIPNIFTGTYLRTVANFGGLIEARSAWRTQDLPIFTRMIDKDSHWGDNNGLYTLITTLLQMNMNGYSMVLPDMIGGNGYDMAPTTELIIRWTQANVFMPAMQFSYLPWDYPSDEYDSAAIIKKFVDLHEGYADEIIRAMEANIRDGTPVNPPIWWFDPTDPIALATDDEFLLGEHILVAPIYEEGATSRDIYLPQGHWKDANSDLIHKGPTTIRQYAAPIDVLPYFINIPSI